MDNKQKVLRLIGDIPLFIAMAGLVFAVTMTAVNVVTRYFLSFTYAGTPEMISLAFTWMIFGGTAYAFKLGKHYGIDILVNAFPQTVQKLVRLLVDMVMILVMFYCARLSVTYTMNVADSPMPALRISYAWYYASAIYGFGMMLIYAVEDLVRDLKKLMQRGGGEA